MSKLKTSALTIAAVAALAGGSALYAQSDKHGGMMMQSAPSGTMHGGQGDMAGMMNMMMQMSTMMESCSNMMKNTKQNRPAEGPKAPPASEHKD